MREPRPGVVAPGDGGPVVADLEADFLQPIRGELQAFEQRLRDTVHADLGPVAEAMEYIVGAGGKRLRPALVILAARLGDPDLEEVYRGAMAIEFIHNATLIHDDLIDRAPTRRGLRTIHESLGPNPAIIIGDYYFAKGANLMSLIGNPRVDLLLSQAVMSICYGEMLQLTSQRKYHQSLREYQDKIERKTAALLSASVYVGGVLGRLAEAEVEALRRFGHLLGMAFQIADDVLDYLGSAGEIGKPIGQDIAEGFATLPFMLASLKTSLHDGRKLTVEESREAVQLVRESGAPQRALERARDYATKARNQLDVIDEGEARNSLAALTDYVVTRKL